MAEILKIKEIEDLQSIEDNSDILCALAYASEFWDVHCCAIVKEENPVGVALSGLPYEAKIKALDCNPVEAIGATIAFSKEIDKETAKSLSRMNFNTIICSKINEDAVKYLEKCENRIIEILFKMDAYKKFLNENKIQDLTPKGFKVATKLKPTQEQVEDMVFAWKVLKNINRDAVIISKDFKIRAIEFGTTISSIEKAMDNACDGSKEAILAISKNVNDPKQLHSAIQGRITGIIEPKNYSNTDSEVIKTAEKYGITIITVGAE